MIKHIFKTLWAERRSNTWIMLELILVFTILWFCCDYLFFTAKRYFEPKGFDIEHTYLIKFGMKSETRKILNNLGEEQIDSLYIIAVNDGLQVIDRIKQHPAIQSVSCSYASYPYSGANSNQIFSFDTTSYSILKKHISPEFLEVFNISFQQGRAFLWDDLVGDRSIIISPLRDNTFLKQESTTLKQINTQNKSEKGLAVLGVTNKMKYHEFRNYTEFVFYPLKREQIVPSHVDVCLRVKTNADNNFIETFTKEMQSQLDIGPYFMTTITSFEDIRTNTMKWNGYDNNFKSIYAVMAFLIINIFLGIIGTFWFRTQARYNEIGLRVALGASKIAVKQMFLLETLFMLLIASLISIIICVNISILNILSDLGIPSVNRNREDVGSEQYIINYFLTFFILLGVIAISVWYPAKKASDVQPAEALHNE